MVAAPIPRRAASPASRSERSARDGRDLRHAALLGLGLAAIVALRYAAIQGRAGDPIVAGLAFGTALLLLAASDRLGAWHRPAWARPAWPRIRTALGRGVVLGVGGGLPLVLLALAGRALGHAPDLPPIFRQDLFPAWAFATIVVAAGEEAVLRGALMTRLTASIGLTPAVVVTSLAFALMHVPFYGWRVVPLDLGVGLWLAGMWLASRGLIAPTIAHALADLATWWL